MVVTFNCGTFLDDFAAHYTALTYPNKALWFVDNASTDGSEIRLPQLFPTATVLQSARNLGFAAGVNLALSHCSAARPDFVLLLNPDAKPAPDCLERLLESADAHTLAGAKIVSATTGRLMTHAGPFSWPRGNSVRTHWDEPADSAFLEETEVDVAGFVCMLIPMSAFEAVGPLDDSFGMYVEDIDFCLKVRRAGFRVMIQPGAVVEHRGHGSSDGGKVFYQHYAARNHAWLIARHGGRRRYAYLPVYFGYRLCELRNFVVPAHWGQAKSQLTGLRDFLLRRRGMTHQPQDFHRTRSSRFSFAGGASALRVRDEASQRRVFR